MRLEYRKARETEVMIEMETVMTAGTEKKAAAEWKAKDKEYIVGTYGRFDLLAERGSGAVCQSPEGKEYIDFTSGIGVNSLGFCDPDWIRAVTDQLGKLQHISNLYYTMPQIRLAEELTSRTGMAKAFFCNSGAEANEVAIKTARKYGSTVLAEQMKKDAGAPTDGPERANRIITLRDSFHGRTMATITATGQDHYHQYFTPFVEGFDYCAPGDAEHLSSLICDDTCAIMIELIQGEGGVNDLSQEFAGAVQDLCREHGLLLIIDEVQTGIGRTGTLFAYEQYGLQPDIVTFAKGIGGGLPIGGALMAETCCHVLAPGDHGTTFGGNPAICAGALAVLQKLDAAMLEEIRAKGEYIRQRLSALPEVTELTGRGMMIGISLKDKDPKEVLAEALEKGLLVLTAGDRLRLLPPLTISREELDRGLSILEDCLQQI